MQNTKISHYLKHNYFKKNHTVNINGENIAMLNDYSLLYGITPWKLKQEEFGKFADYLICNNMLGNNIALTKDTLILLGDLSYELSLYDIGLVVCKINSIINKSVKELKEYKMFTFNELMCLYNDCYDYIEEEMPKIKKLERR